MSFAGPMERKSGSSLGGPTIGLLGVKDNKVR